MLCVADWSQAKIGYTLVPIDRVNLRLRIGLRPRLVTLSRVLEKQGQALRIGLRPRLVTLS